MPDASQFSREDVDRLLKEQEDKINAKWKTDTIDGKVSALSEEVRTNHKDVIRRLDEVNHVKETFTKRFDVTERKIEDAMSKQTEMMASHLSSPQHTMISEHIASITPLEDATKKLGPEDIAFLPKIIRDARFKDETSRRRRFFNRNLELNASTTYLLLASTMILGSILTFLATHIHILH